MTLTHFFRVIGINMNERRKIHDVHLRAIASSLTFQYFVNKRGGPGHNMISSEACLQHMYLLVFADSNDLIHFHAVYSFEVLKLSNKWPLK